MRSTLAKELDCQSQSSNVDTVKSALPPEQVLVTTRELVEALARIEESQAAEESSDKIKIGDAIRDLGLSISAEEILKAVRENSNRSTQADKSRSMPLHRRISMKLRVALCAAIFIAVTAAATVGYFQFNNPAPAPIISYTQFIQALKHDQISSAYVTPTTIEGSLSSGIAYSVRLPDQNALARNTLYEQIKSGHHVQEVGIQ